MHKLNARDGWYGHQSEGQKNPPTCAFYETHQLKYDTLKTDLLQPAPSQEETCPLKRLLYQDFKLLAVQHVIILV